MRKNPKGITYAYDRECSYSWIARYGDEVAATILDFASGTPENGFAMGLKVERCGTIMDLCFSYQGRLVWTKKIPLELKNEFRKAFGLRPVKEKAK
jgi:hypothetical protein